MECFTPVLIPFVDKNGDKAVNRFPCGKCLSCLQKKASDWANRLRMEQKRSLTCYFVTLTYNQENLPLIDHEGLVIPTLLREDIKLFIKRIRKSLENPQGNFLALTKDGTIQRDYVPFDKKITPYAFSFRYFFVGEYGPQTNRPHYHGILFNLPFSWDSLSRGMKLHEFLEKKWGKGFVTVRPAEPISLSYTAKYCIKPYDEIDKIRQTVRIQVSKGMGENYISENMGKWHSEDPINRQYIPRERGFKNHLPRYYKSKLFDKDTLKEIREHNEYENYINPKPRLSEDEKKAHEYRALKKYKSKKL